MKKALLFFLIITSTVLLVGCTSKVSFLDSESFVGEKLEIKKVLYFNPEVIPDVFEIKSPTYATYFSAATDKMMTLGSRKYLTVDTTISYDEVDIEIVKELCENNDADMAIISRVKYFKVGLGKYVFSNQVEIGLKIYDASGNFITESTYDTYKTSGRMLGSAENSVKIGTKGALDKLYKELKSRNITFTKS